MKILEGGLRLNATLDGMDVANLWRPRKYVYWETGAAMRFIPPAPYGYEDDTHCSAFAAAAALNLGVYLLSPLPEILLANRQAEWLKTLPAGWQNVNGPVEAQALANEGYMVVISYLNPNPRASGHIQVVRAYDTRPDQEIAVVGPQIIQAGKTNFNSTTAAEGFSSGYAASYSPYPWPNNVEYYAHTTDYV
jgi:hypothetical protein